MHKFWAYPREIEGGKKNKPKEGRVKLARSGELTPDKMEEKGGKNGGDRVGAPAEGNETPGNRGGSNGAASNDEEDPSKGETKSYVPTPVDRNMQEVYRYWVHVNYGRHLTGNIRHDIRWQSWWQNLGVFPL